MKAVIYARYSSDNQREESIDGQLRECREYANKNGIEVINTYIDRALSAKTDNRPEFQRMIRDSAKGLFDIVLVWKLDRFARNRYDSAHYKATLRKNGAKVVSATEAIAEDSTGILLESLLEGYAEFYSVELSEKIRRGLKENALKGKSNGGHIPYGYVAGENQTLDIDPLTAPIVLEIFQRYSDGETLKEIEQSLNDRGLRMRKERPFGQSSFYKMLKNRKYIGEYQFQDVVIPDGVPAIVPEELFQRVQKRLHRNKSTPASAKAEEIYLLTTKLFCGRCGKMMVGESGTSRTGQVYYYYKCGDAKRNKGCKKKAVKKEWIENLVVTHTVQMIFDDALMERVIDKVWRLQKKENPDLAILKKQISDVEKGIENLVNAIQAGVFSESTKRRLDNLEQQKKDLSAALVQTELKSPVLTREQISFFIYQFRKMDITDPKQKQCLVDSFINSIYLFDDRIVLTFNCKDDSQTIPFDTVKSSDLVADAPPKESPHSF